MQRNLQKAKKSGYLTFYVSNMTCPLGYISSSSSSASQRQFQKVIIWYGSHYGTTATKADTLYNGLRKMGKNDFSHVECKNLKDFKESDFQSNENENPPVHIFFISTCGNGNVPRSAKRFLQLAGTPTRQ